MMSLLHQNRIKIYVADIPTNCNNHLQNNYFIKQSYKKNNKNRKATVRLDISITNKTKTKNYTYTFQF